MGRSVGRGRHRFVALDHFGYCCQALCGCGWLSDVHPSDERALLAYGRHRARAIVRLLVGDRPAKMDPTPPGSP